MRKCGHGKASILVGCCQFRRYACPSENHRFSHAWSPLFPPLLFLLTRAQSPPPPPSSSWSGSCSCAESWSVHAYARGSGALLTRRAVAVSLHAQGLCVGFSHARSKRNRGCRLGFSVQEPSRARGLCVSSLTDLWSVYICFPLCVAVWWKCSHAQTVWGSFSHVVSRAHYLCFGAVVSPTFCWLWCSISFWATVDFQSVG